VPPKIDSYEFGRIVIDGREYRADVIILPERVVADWRGTPSRPRTSRTSSPPSRNYL
jgi:hypothetical protein